MLLAFGISPTADAQPPSTVTDGMQASIVGPRVTLSSATVSPGDHVVLTIEGFEAQSLVTVSVCGNGARRGSADCNMVASEAIRLNDAGPPTLADLAVSVPPASCPCLIRVASQSYDQVAVAPITLQGHPIAPLVGGPSPDDRLIAVSIDARSRSSGALAWIRSSLGGSVEYQVTVTVKNLTTDTLRHVGLSASVGRKASDSGMPIEFDRPAEIGPGQTWQQVVPFTLSAPSIGTMKWRVVVSGAGPTVTAVNSIRHRPTLLLVLITILVITIATMISRRRMRRRAARQKPGSDDRRGAAVPPDESVTTRDEEPASVS
jgi:hypothetical protein